jgi:hypothetical protein
MPPTKLAAMSRRLRPTARPPTPPKARVELRGICGFNICRESGFRWIYRVGLIGRRGLGCSRCGMEGRRGEGQVVLVIHIVYIQYTYIVYILYIYSRQI